MRRLIGALVLLATCAPGDAGTRTEQVPVESSAPIDVTRLNAIVDQAGVSGQAWPTSPTLVALHVIGTDSETRQLVLRATGNRSEGPDSSVVIVTRDGFLDDSVRGDWHRLTLYRTGDGTWRVAEALRAQRCWRGGGGGYRADPCP